MGSTVKNWNKLNKFEVFENRVLLTRFAKEYEGIFGERINVGCRRCLNEAYQKIINYKNKDMEKVNDCDYLLKAKYEGTFWKGNPIRNGDLTNKVGNDLLKNHKAGALLFERIPKVKTETKVKVKVKK